MKGGCTANKRRKTRGEAYPDGTLALPKFRTQFKVQPVVATISESDHMGKQTSREEDTVAILKKRNFKVGVTVGGQITTMYPLRSVLDTGAGTN